MIRKVATTVCLMMMLGLHVRGQSPIERAKQLVDSISAETGELKGIVDGLQPPPTLPTRLLSAADLTLSGSFKVPFLADPLKTFSYGGNALAFNPAHNSLFMQGHVYGQLTAEVSIPSIMATGPLNTLPVATMLQPFTDIFEGMRLNIDGDKQNGAFVGGLLPFGNGKMVASVFDYYDGNGTQTLTHFIVGQDFSVVGDVQGPFSFYGINTSTSLPKAGMTSAFMAPIPPEWQAALGGTALTGNGAIPIISRTSYGPAAFAFDPTNLGTAGQTVVPLLYYPAAFPNLGNYGSSASTGYNGTQRIGGVVFPNGTATILFFESIGLGTFCYGQGTLDISLDRTTVPGTNGAVIYCYDPMYAQDKGIHGYPYEYYVLAYDAHDFKAVKDGAKKPWEVLPYDRWTLTLPYIPWRTIILGATFDPATNRIYLAQAQADGFGDPVIQVLTIR